MVDRLFKQIYNKKTSIIIDSVTLVRFSFKYSIFLLPTVTYLSSLFYSLRETLSLGSNNKKKPFKHTRSYTGGENNNWDNVATDCLPFEICCLQ